MFLFCFNNVGKRTLKGTGFVGISEYAKYEEAVDQIALCNDDKVIVMMKFYTIQSKHFTWVGIC